MRRATLAISAVCALCTLAPAPAVAGPHPECRRMTRQIEHFEGVVELAEERGNALWEAETRRHIGRLELQRARRCPKYAEEMKRRNLAQKAAYETGKFLKKAGMIALRVFTFGAYGL